ncbi:MAG TPA: hypothetical protein VKD90_09390 [Gemmataceae bacterium]|nr:hypothetical protein [Gemmataceae bacterium]
MGAHPYWYVTKYTPDPQVALDALRQQEFRAGRYNPVIRFLNFPIGPHSPAPGARHATIAEAFEDADADGTRSILDIETVGDEPDFGVAVPVDDDFLEELYGTTRPTRARVLENLEFFEDLERGHAVYVTLYRDGRPDEYVFAGYSYD